MYTIEILDSEKFDNLPVTITKGSDISDSLGFADPATGKAYVRYVAYPELQKYLVDHEFEELVEGHEGHEDENGIRHKGFRDTISRAAPAIGAVAGTALPGVGNLLGGAIGGALGGAGGRLLQGGGRTFRSVGGSALKGGLLGGAGGAATQGFGTPGATQGGFLSRFGQNLAGQAKSGFGIPSALKRFGGFFLGSPAQAATGQGVSPSLGPSSGMFTQPLNFATSGIGQAQSGQAIRNFLGGGGGGGGGGGDGVRSLLTPRNLLGAGILGAGLLKPFPNAPDSSASLDRFRSFSQSGGGPLSEQVRGVLSEQLTNPINSAEIEAGLRQFRESRSQQRDVLINMFKSLRPGTDPLTDTGLKREIDQFDQETARLESDFVANRARDVQRGAIGAASSQEQFEANMLSQVAQMDEATLMQEFSLDAENARFMKETLANLGSGILDLEEEDLLKQAILAKILGEA